MELVSLVSDLLFKHNCVIIPGIGGFVANYTQAEYKSESKTILPPRKKIAFNQSLVDNDGLLVNKLSQLKQISYAQAEKEVNTFSSTLKEKVYTNKSFQFKNIGTFYLNKDENLIFVPYEGLNMLTSSYGLTPVKIRPVYRSNTSMRAPVLNEPKEEVTKEVVLENTLRIEQEIPARRGFMRKVLPWVSAAAVVVFLAFSYQYLSKTEFPSELFQSNQVGQDKTGQNAALLGFDSQPATKVETATLLEDVTPALDETKSSIAEVSSKVIPTDTDALEANTTAASSSSEIDEDWLNKWKALQTQTTFYVVVQKTTNPNIAESAVNQLKAKGYNAKQVAFEGQTYVSVESFTSMANAKEYIQYIKRSYNQANIIEITK